ncbi:MAG: hypothetical protein P9X24_18555 [Candidatus Hatepunaea meridiana]|nr:hypothetical protein [Candidatus Hatepunaea meridiana]
MTPIKHHQSNPDYLVEYGEIDIPNDKFLGTGSFTMLLKPNAININSIISSQMVNVPVFQISLNINLNESIVSVLLGKADGSDPLSRKEFLLPKDIDGKPSHKFIANFVDWQITSLELDGIPLFSQNPEEVNRE